MSKAAPKFTRRSLLRSMGFGAAASIGVTAYADGSAQWIQLERRTLTLPRWNAKGFRVGLISDLHANNASDIERAQRAIRMAIAESPNVLLIPGDFIDSSNARVLEALKGALEPLREARCPVLATLGNHDYWTHDPKAVIECLRQCPLKLLRNETAEVDGVTIAGIDDGIAMRQRFDFLNAGRESRSLIAMFHEPDFVDEVPKHISLQLSGHSHGGQVCFPGGIPFHTPFGARKYISGFYAQAKVPLYVTRGVGTTGPDVRTFCRPEVTILTLQ
jgi:predicted MPP superfamily phosphohydrolase